MFFVVCVFSILSSMQFARRFLNFDSAAFIFHSGIFYGHTDMVFYILYNLWWSLWYHPSSRGGELPSFCSNLSLQLDAYISSICFSADCIIQIQIRTMGMVRSRFHSLPSRFNDFLVPRTSTKENKRTCRNFLHNKIFKVDVFLCTIFLKLILSIKELISLFF